MLTPGDKTDDSLIGRVIAGKYRVEELLGTGAMGKVYKAHHVDLDKPVAVKVLHAVDAKDPSLTGRFKTEARASSRLDHPNSVQILDFGEDGADKLLYITMELLVGQSLGDVLKRVNQLSARRSLNIMSQVLAALAAAHRSGIVHRDLKPANIMLIKKREDEADVQDFVKVLDFGIAKVLEPGTPDDPTAMMTKAGAIFGTPAFMSPEQARGERVDARSDIYASGVLLYKMITGHTPYKSETATGLITKMMTEPPTPMNRHLSTVDLRIEQIVSRAMAREKSDRFQNAGEMRQAIRDVLESGTYPLDHTIPPAGSPPPIAHTSSAGIQPLPLVTTHPPPTSPFQTLSGGTPWGPNGTLRPSSMQAAPPRSSRKMAAIVAIVVLLIVGGVVFAKRAPDPMPHLNELIASGAYAVAETFMLEHFAELEARPEVGGLVQRILESRRKDEQYERRLNFTFDSSYKLAASSWRGTSYYSEQKTTYRFTLAFEKVTEHTLEGYFDWPDQGVRAAIRGIHDGNHLVFWDYKLIAGSGPHVKSYILNEKQTMFVAGDRLVMPQGLHGEKLEAQIAQ